MDGAEEPKTPLDLTLLSALLGSLSSQSSGLMLTVRVVCHLLVLTVGSLQQSQNTQHSDKSEKAKPFMEGHGEVLNHQPDWMEMQDQSTPQRG